MASNHPRETARQAQRRLQETMDAMRSDIDAVDEPQLKALLETSAEVLGGLRQAFGDCERRNEEAWR